MKRTLIPTMAIVALGSAVGCTNAPGSPTTTPTPTPSAAPACPAGSWRSTEVAARGSVAGATVTLGGGAGVVATIDPDGPVTADFGGMEPAMFSTSVAGAQVEGELFYRGSVSGDVDLGAGGAKPTQTGPTTAPGPDGPGSPTPTATGSGGGAWRPTGDVHWADLAVTVRLTSPASLTVLDNVKLADVTNSQVTQAGGVIDLQPLLREGTYQCQGEDTLIVTPDGDGPTVAWTFARES